MFIHLYFICVILCCRLAHIPTFCGFILVVIYLYTIIRDHRTQEWPKITSALRGPVFHGRQKSLYFIPKMMKDMEGGMVQGREMVRDNHIRLSN